MNLNTRRLGTIGALLVSLSLVTSACGGSSDSGSSGSGSGGSGGSKGAISVTFLPKNLGNPYFDTSDKGGATAVKAFGGTYKQVGPSEATPDGQVPFINTAAQQGTKALVVSAEPQYRDVFVNQASTEGIAKVQVDMVTKDIGDSGEVAILSAAANATNQNAWIKLIKADLAANHPKVKLVDTVYGNDDDQTSFDKTAALLQSHPDLKGIISPTTVGIAAAARYISTSQYKGKVDVTGLGTPNQMRKYVNDGTVKQFALWNPADLGYLAAYTAKALVDGDITGKEGDTYTAGKLGKYTVGKDGTVLLGDPFVFDKSNIAKFNF
jgi:rhamnose transport system substrate-binding protein